MKNLSNLINFPQLQVRNRTVSANDNGIIASHKPIILACLSRSFDVHHKDGNLHLICSMVYYNKEISFTNLVNSLNFIKITKYIVRLVFNEEDFESEDINKLSEKTVTEHSPYLIEIQLSFNKFLSYLYLFPQKDLFDLIFGSVFEISKDFNSISNNVLFIFEGIDWDNILLIFKIKNITISGGTISKRQYLSTVEINLSQFILLIDNFKIDSKLIYGSYKHTSNSIICTHMSLNESKSSIQLLKDLGEYSSVPINKVWLDNQDSFISKNKLINDQINFYLHKSNWIKILEDNVSIRESNINSLRVYINKEKTKLLNIEKNLENKIILEKHVNRSINSINSVSKESVILILQRKNKKITNKKIERETKRIISKLDRDRNSLQVSTNAIHSLSLKQTKIVNALSILDKELNKKILALEHTKERLNWLNENKQISLDDLKPHWQYLFPKTEECASINWNLIVRSYSTSVNYNNLNNNLKEKSLGRSGLCSGLFVSSFKRRQVISSFLSLRRFFSLSTKTTVHRDSQIEIDKQREFNKDNNNFLYYYQTQLQTHINICNFRRGSYLIPINNRYYSTVSTDTAKINRNYFIDSPIFLELQRIILNETIDHKSQEKIEEFLIKQGTIFLKSKLDEQLDINYYKLTPLIQTKLKNSIKDLKKLLYNYTQNLEVQIKEITSKSKQKKISLSKSQKLKELQLKHDLLTVLSKEDKDLIIILLLGRLLKIISNNNLINKNTICIEVTKDLVNSLVFFYYKFSYSKLSKKVSQKKETSLSKNLFDTNNEYDNESDLKKLSLREIIYKSKVYEDLESDSFTVPFGFQLFKLLEELGLLKIHTLTLSKDYKQSIFIPSEIILEKIGDYSNLLDITYKIPMIVEPKKYSRSNNKTNLGGYLLNDKLFISDLIIKNPELREQSQIESNNHIFDMVNNLSSVGFKINIQVLDFIMDNNSKLGFFTDPDFINPLQIKLNKNFYQSQSNYLTQNKQKTRFSKLSQSEHKNLEAFLSKKQLEMNILGLAFIFKNVGEFFIPVRIDNRGRVYCISEYLNYQGIELAKSLLLFSKGEEILKSDQKSIDYLKIFGANCFGNGLNKKSYVNRVDWVNKNEANILNFKNGDLIKKADSKLLFLAFCFEYENYKNSLNNENTFYLSHFPIQLDATCNGYQHLSLLTGNEPLAGELNLLSDTTNSIPKDFYTFMIFKLKDFFEDKINEIKNKHYFFHQNKNNINNGFINKDFNLNSNLDLERSNTDIINNKFKDNTNSITDSDKKRDTDVELRKGKEINTGFGEEVSSLDFPAEVNRKDTNKSLHTDGKKVIKTEREREIEIEINKVFKTELLNRYKDNYKAIRTDTQNKEFQREETELLNSYERLEKLNIHRKLIKIPLMVKPYNASLYQMVNYIKEKFDTQKLSDLDLDLIKSYKLENINKETYLYVYKEDPNILLTIKDFYILTKSIENILYTEFPKLQAFNNYLKKVAEICSILNITITWSLPSGLNVHQYYKDTEAIRLKPFKFSTKTFNLVKFINKLNKAKQIRALMPNLIHSLDAASLSLIVDMFFNMNLLNNPTEIHNPELKLEEFDLNYFKIKKNFYSIHDCFAVTANNVEELIKIIKLVYIKIYSDNIYLREFDLGIINSIKSHYGKESFNEINKEIKINDHIIQYPDVELIIVGRINAESLKNSTYIIN